MNAVPEIDGAYQLLSGSGQFARQLFADQRTFGSCSSGCDQREPGVPATAWSTTSLVCASSRRRRLMCKPIRRWPANGGAGGRSSVGQGALIEGDFRGYGGRAILRPSDSIVSVVRRHRDGDARADRSVAADYRPKLVLDRRILCSKRRTMTNPLSTIPTATNSFLSSGPLCSSILADDTSRAGCRKAAGFEPDGVQRRC